VWDGPSVDVRAVSAVPVVAEEDGRAAPDVTSSSSADAESAGGSGERPAAIERIELPATVAVIGDSLTVSADDEITAALEAAGVDLVIVDARESRRMASGSRDLPSGVSAIGDVVDTRTPDLWVVALGTNDVGSERFGDDLLEVLAALPEGAPLVWVDLWIRDRADEVHEANDSIRRLLASRPSTLVADWWPHGTDDGVITGDGIHLTDAGQMTFAEVIRSAVSDLAAR